MKGGFAVWMDETMWQRFSFRYISGISNGFSIVLVRLVRVFVRLEEWLCL